MAMNQPNSELPNSYNLLFRIIQTLRVPLNNVNISSQSPEVVIALLGAEVSCTQNMLNLPWNQEALELCW